MKNFPKIIQNAINQVDKIFHNDKIRYGRPNAMRSMRIERIQSLIILFKVMLQSACLARDGAFLKLIQNKTARPLTVAEMAFFSQKKQRNIERCLKDARDLGLITSFAQIKRNGEYGLEVSSVLRAFTKKFWLLLGLWSLFVESVKYARKTLITIHLAFKRIDNTGSKKETSKERKEILMLTRQCEFREQLKKSKINNEIFKLAYSCEYRQRYGNNCPGGKKRQDVCTICKEYFRE